MSDFQMELPECVRRVAGVDGLPALEVRGPRSSGVIQLHGGQVTSFVPSGGTELLWLSPSAQAEPQRAIRGGVPVCFPWFGAGLDGRLEPSHGPARLARWRVQSAAEQDGAVVVTLVLTPDAVVSLPGAEHWPEGVFASLTITFADVLGLELTVRNEGERDASVEAALHAYLAVADVRSTTVSGLDGCAALDQVTVSQTHVDGAIGFGGEVDLMVTAPGRDITVVYGGESRVLLTREGFPEAVVWNPSAGKAAGMADVPDGAWSQFVCVEAAAVRADALEVPAGTRRSVRATYAPLG